MHKAKAAHILSAKIFAYIRVIFNDQNFNDTLTNDIDIFKQLGPDHSDAAPLITIPTIIIHLSITIYISFSDHFIYFFIC